MPVRKYVIHAIHDLDIDELLKNLGLIEPLERGDLKCDICGCQVKRENLGSIFPQNGRIKVCCIKVDCLERVMAERREMTYG